MEMSLENLHVDIGALSVKGWSLFLSKRLDKGSVVKVFINSLKFLRCGLKEGAFEGYSLCQSPPPLPSNKIGLFFDARGQPYKC